MARFWCLAFVFVAVTVSEHPNACTDENGEPGNCTGLTECHLTAERVKKPTAADFKYFDSIRCGFDKQRNPKVCCPIPKKMETLYDENLWPAYYECRETNTLKIIHGENTTLGEFPFMARISRGASFHCGASLINNRYIITAAHCANDVIKVRLGEWRVSTDIDCDEDGCADAPKDFTVENITIHEDYDRNSYKNDIALIRLAESVNFTNWISPVCLPHDENLISRNLVNDTVVVTGWGYIDQRLPIKSDILMKAALMVYDRSACEKAYDVTLLNPEQICVGSDTGTDSCKGDSGGPASVVEQIIPPYNLLVGLVSIGHIECGSLNFPAIYTNVAAYMPWIYKHVKL